MREFGAAIKEMDLIDESKLSSEQMRVMIATLLYDGVKRNLPHPDENWESFVSAVNQKNNTVFCVRQKKFKSLIDVKKLKDIYGDNSGAWSGSSSSSQVCSISWNNAEKTKGRIVK